MSKINYTYNKQAVMAQFGERKFFSSGNISGNTKIVFVEGTSGTGKTTTLGRLEKETAHHMGRRVIIRDTEYSWMVKRFPGLKNKHLSKAMGQVYTATKLAEVVRFERVDADYVVIDRSPFSGMLYDYLWEELETGVEKFAELTRALEEAIKLGWWQSNYKMIITIVGNIPKCLEYMKLRNSVELDSFQPRYIELQNKYMRLLASLLPESDVIVHTWEDHMPNNEDLVCSIRCLGGTNFINNAGRYVASDAGIDLPLAQDVKLAKGEVLTAPTTVTTYLSPYHFATVSGRSSANKLAHISLGIIDSFYGEPISIRIRALEDLEFKAGRAIAQMVIQERAPLNILSTPYENIKLIQKQRGGFGSTNKELKPTGYIHSDTQSFPIF